MPWTGKRKIINRILNPSPTYQANCQISKVLSMIPENSKIIDLGAGGRKITPDTISIDFVKIGDTKIIADIHRLPVKTGIIDGVFCTGTLEHVEYPEKVIKEIYRITKPKSIIYIDVPFMQCYHPDPVDYWRFTIKGLELICIRNGLSLIESGVNIGVASSLTWISMEFFQAIFSNRLLNKMLTPVLGNLILPLKYLDKFIINNRNNYAGASAVYFIGTKS